MSKLIAMVVLGVGAMFLAIVLTGCSSDPVPTATPTATPTLQDQLLQELVADRATATALTPTPTAAPTAAPTNTPTAASAALSLDEYLAQLDCASSDEEPEPETYGEFSVLAQKLIDERSALVPPAEVADWHNRSLEILQTFKGLVDSQPEDQVIGIEFFGIAAVLEGLQEAVTQAENELPDDVRQRMVEAGCVEDPSAATPAMEPTAAPSDPDDHGDNIDDATVAEVGVPTAGVIGDKGEDDHDRDFFRFTAVGGQFYRFDIELGTLTNAAVKLLNSQGREIASNTGNFWDTPSSHLIASTSSAGVYYVRVSGFYSGARSSGLGSYTLNISRHDVPDDHSDTHDGAIPIAVGGTTEGAINMEGDVDYFRLTVEEKGQYQIFVSIGTLDVLRVQRKQNDSGLWTYSDIYAGWTDAGPDCGTAHTECIDLEPGDHYFLVGSYGGTGTYTLTVTAIEDESADNNRGNSALTQLTDNSARDNVSEWSPDGSRIAFNSDRDGDYEIYVMNADGSGVIQLTDNLDYDGGPVWSPDGSRIAFNSDRDGDYEIYVMNADGSGVIQLTDNFDSDRDPAWSPDGSRIAFNSNRDWGFQIYVMNADGSGVIQLTDNSANSALDLAPAWSPDGSKIAFRSDRDGDYDIYVMNADGSGVIKLTDNFDRDGGQVWSPDGSRIAFHSDRDWGYQIYVMNADGSGVIQLTDNFDSVGPVWSPDGSRIAFHSDRDGDYEIYVIAIDR